MYHFKNAEELLALAKKHRCPISEIAIRYEMENADRKRREIENDMLNRWRVIEKAVEEQLKRPRTSTSGMSGKSAVLLVKYVKKGGKTMLGKVATQSMIAAMATGEHNAGMGRILAFPTAGASGIMPGVLFALREHMKCNDRDMIRAMFNASAIGKIIAENATVAGAKGGCQAEIGAALAMAASSATEVRGGTPEACLSAAAIGLKSILGLICDPIGGLVEVPCIKRNALGAVYALAASDLVVAGVRSFVCFDEVVATMFSVAKKMPYQWKETALGGLAQTKTAKRVTKKLGIKISKDQPPPVITA